MSPKKLYFFRVVFSLFGIFLSVSAMAMEAWNDINAERMVENIRILSSDEYEGRAPATKGEELTTRFIEKKCKELGLKPANAGSYFQNVPMVGITADPTAQLLFVDSSRKKQMVLTYAEEFVAFTKHERPQVSVDGDLIFVGYGIEAPEYDWDDFKGVDVKGKILVMLINDPPVPDPHDPSKLDEKTFKGKAMTYYGRWTNKFEMAAKKGAKGCLIVHQTDPARYPWSVVKSSYTGEQFSLISADKGMSWSPVEGWITYEKAKELFAMSGKDFDSLMKAAACRDFYPVDLGVRASLTLNNTIRTIESKNVIAKLEGSDPNLVDECVIYSAHWDHLGIGLEVAGDKIYHGAIDNASGVAGLLEIARAFTRVQPKRSILFLFTTAEEKGLLGSQYYTEHPLYPLDKTVANINLDGLNMWGLTRDIGIIGWGRSTLDEVVQAVAIEQERVVSPDSKPEDGHFYRADHFNFAKHGVCVIYPMMGFDFVDRPAGWGEEVWKNFFAENYHKPSDQLKDYFNLSGAVQDLKLIGEAGYRVANAKDFPKWKENSEFKR